MKACHSINALITFALLLQSGCAGSPPIAQPGEYIQADFTCRLGDRGLVETTLANVAGDEEAAKSTIFTLHDNYRPLRFKVPETPGVLHPAPLAPLEQKIGMAIANRGNELSLEQTNFLELQSSEIENFPPADRYVEMARRFLVPRTKEIPIQDFKALYGSTPPVKGSIVDGDSDFPGVVQAISTDSITIHYSARAKGKALLPYGFAFIQVKDKHNFEATMDVQVGQLFKRVGGLPGRITTVDEKKYVIDFGQSFAGETLYCEVTARPFDPAQASQPVPIEWIEDYEKGLALARQQGKPVVLFLYSDGCPYCHQMEDKVFPDPSLNQFKNSFVWVKINSEKQTEYGERFKQQGFPLTLVLNSVGGELDRFSGLQHVTTLASKLDHILSPKKKG